MFISFPKKSAAAAPAVRPAVPAAADPAPAAAPAAAVLPAVPAVRPAVVSVRAPDPLPDDAAVLTAADSVRFESVDTLQPLRGSGRRGDFVHNTQEMDATFRNVSRGWTQRLSDPDDKSVMSFDDAISHVSALVGESEDYLTDFASLRPVIDSGRFCLQDSRSGRVFELSENALNQFSERTGIGRTLPRRLIVGDTDDLQTLQTVARNGLRKIAQEKPVLLRIRDRGTVRAFLSEEYSRIDHAWFLDTLRRIVPGGIVSHFRADENADSIWFNVLIPDSIRAESDSEYGGMVAAGNGETGLNRLHTMPSIFRAICCNGCIWDREDGIAFVDQVHRGAVDLGILAHNICDNLNRQIPLLSSGIDSMLSTKRIVSAPAADPLLILGATLQALDISAITRPHADVIFTRFGEQRTEDSRVSAFDVIQGFTRAAQDFGAGLQEITERAAGAAMSWDADHWQTVFRAADRLQEKQLRKIFQVSGKS